MPALMNLKSRLNGSGEPSAGTRLHTRIEGFTGNPPNSASGYIT